MDYAPPEVKSPILEDAGNAGEAGVVVCLTR